MRVDPRDLRRNVGAQAHHASRELVHQREGLQVEIVAGAGEQRLDVFQQRRHDQLVTVGAEQIEEVAPQPLDARGFERENVLDVFGQYPGTHQESGLSI